MTTSTAETDEQTALVHPFSLPACVLEEVSAAGFWSFYHSASQLLIGTEDFMLVGAMEDDPHPSAPPNPRFPLK